ncbi:hypothetical protein CHS0354_031362 [Potamilus streckersoni]|uniref:Caspase family p10 domain-containing protein n=1 Tax=Potamilus streckersoni TaxID=2493646 RepID=A0AAE0SKY9_9BIVA|nr:hypothetical protein CHS0354_031362 [Potamilus streckersoni]
MNYDRVLIKPIKNTESDPLLQSKDDTDVMLFGDILDDTPMVHCNNDCLVMYAVPSGYFAWRNTVDGSWMLHYLFEEVKNYNLRTPCSFLKVLTAVTRKMAIRETNVPGNEKKVLNACTIKPTIPFVMYIVTLYFFMRTQQLYIQQQNSQTDASWECAMPTLANNCSYRVANSNIYPSEGFKLVFIYFSGSQRWRYRRLEGCGITSEDANRQMGRG